MIQHVPNRCMETGLFAFKYIEKPWKDVIGHGEHT